MVVLSGYRTGNFWRPLCAWIGPHVQIPGCGLSIPTFTPCRAVKVPTKRPSAASESNVARLKVLRFLFVSAYAPPLNSSLTCVDSLPLIKTPSPWSTMPLSLADCSSALNKSLVNEGHHRRLVQCNLPSENARESGAAFQHHVPYRIETLSASP